MEIIEANACEDHIHMLVTIPPKLSVSRFMRKSTGKRKMLRARKTLKSKKEPSKE